MFSQEAIQLFARLEATPRRVRKGDQWESDRLQLNAMVELGVIGFWLSLNEDVPEPDEDPASISYQDWEAVRDKRLALLAAARAAGLL
jgi:hypothetical protein